MCTILINDNSTLHGVFTYSCKMISDSDWVSKKELMRPLARSIHLILLVSLYLVSLSILSAWSREEQCILFFDGEWVSKREIMRPLARYIYLISQISLKWCWPLSLPTNINHHLHEITVCNRHVCEIYFMCWVFEGCHDLWSVTNKDWCMLWTHGWIDN